MSFTDLMTAAAAADRTTDRIEHAARSRALRSARCAGRPGVARPCAHHASPLAMWRNWLEAGRL